MALGLVVALASALVMAVDAKPSRADAASLRQKVALMTRYGTARARQPRRTLVTQNEVNAFLAFDAADQIPAGIVDPAVSILGGGRVTARAIVDLDAVRKQKERGVLDPMNWISGRVPVTATGVLQATRGVARVNFESAAVGPIPVPKLVLQEIVSYYSRTPDNPSGVGLDDPFKLPANINEIQVEVGRAIVVQ